MIPPGFAALLLPRVRGGGEDGPVTQLAGADADALLSGLTVGRPGRLLHVHRVPPRAAEPTDWPAWVHPVLISSLTRMGVVAPWSHQAAAASLAAAGQHVVLATGTASGKSLAYLLPVLTAALEGTNAPNGRAATTLYLSPTKALAHDQLRAITNLELPGVRAATYDGDTASEERAWVRQHAHVVLSNPDLLHRSLLPGHSAWSSFLRALHYVVIDECHTYRGIFGSHVANVIRRLTRVAARYGSHPTFILASATTSSPEDSCSRLTGQSVQAVTRDGSPHGATAFALWEPALQSFGGENDAPTRRTATAETADLLADLVASGVRTLAFTRSRRGAEAIAMSAREKLARVDAEEGTNLAGQVAAYRGGYLPEERRQLEKALRSGTLSGMSTTSALELGVDVSGLDAVLIAGWPGTRASLWQQAGRAGRSGSDALAVLVARDDPLDTYLVNHPAAVFGAPVEASVSDPTNPYVLGPHLAAAAAELPLTPEDLPAFGANSREVVDNLVSRGLLRSRPAGWFWTRRERAADLADLRGIGGGPVRVVEVGTGRLLGTVDLASAHSAVHQGAVYVHQGTTYLIDHLDLEASVAHAHPEIVDYTTSAREVTEIRVVAETGSRSWGAADLTLGVVDVSSQVVAYLKRRYLSGEVVGEEPLDLPLRQLRTTAVWWSASAELVESVLEDRDIPGAVHAAEHASIGLLPLVATCDRWDIGGVSTAVHQDTGRCTSFVYDGHPGGAGFAERGFAAARTWLTATRDAIQSCECASGCPSCVQSPKCGNGNEPLDKDGAYRLLSAVLTGSTES
jgi:DEAD/DEAH box helicase domain-containing protein